MEFLLFFVGPLLVFGLPLVLCIFSAVKGFATQPTALDLVRSSMLIVVVSALVVPASANFTSTNQWPAPWWLAAMFGAFEYSGRAFLFISAVGLGLFFGALVIGILFRAKLGRARHEL